MRHWYSPRGARRGLLVAGLAAALWICWAVAYSQGTIKAPAPAPATATTTPVKAQCCLQRLDT
jgi:hypothetical protein